MYFHSIPQICPQTPASSQQSLSMAATSLGLLLMILLAASILMPQVVTHPPGGQRLGSGKQKTKVRYRIPYVRRW
jgi:hypothetical protein